MCKSHAYWRGTCASPRDGNAIPMRKAGRRARKKVSARLAVGSRDLLDRAEGHERRQLGPAHRARQIHLHEAGLTLFILGVLSFASAALGRTARRRRWPGWIKIDITSMGLSHVLVLTAFYVDNGRNLPLWRELPQWAFWVLPSAIGGPIIAFAILRHPLVRERMS